MNELALFAGAGGGILGGHLLGWKCICAVELDPYAASVLLARQNEGLLPPFPVWDDVCTFDGNPWRGFVDVVSGGFPCTDISVAGRGEGIDGAESGLWREMARIIGEIRPRHVLVENSPALTVRGGLRVVGDLAALGYDCRWGIISAADAIWSAGRPCIDHLRERIWIAATRADVDGWRRGPDAARGNDTNGQEAGRDQGHSLAGAVRESISGPESPDVESLGRWAGIVSERASAALPESRNDRAASGDGDGAGFCEQWSAEPIGAEQSTPKCPGWWTIEPDVDRVATGIPARVDRIRCIGMSQVPAVVRLAWETLRP